MDRHEPKRLARLGHSPFGRPKLSALGPWTAVRSQTDRVHCFCDDVLVVGRTSSPFSSSPFKTSSRGLLRFQTCISSRCHLPIHRFFLAAADNKTLASTPNPTSPIALLTFECHGRIPSQHHPMRPYKQSFSAAAGAAYHQFYRVLQQERGMHGKLTLRSQHPPAHGDDAISWPCSPMGHSRSPISPS